MEFNMRLKTSRDNGPEVVREAAFPMDDHPSRRPNSATNIPMLSSVPLGKELTARLRISASEETLFPLSDGCIVGRYPDSGIVIKDRMVSGHHAQIRFTDGKFRIVDLGSRNGTYLNGERVDRSPIAPGDVVRVGSALFEVLAGVSTSLRPGSQVPPLLVPPPLAATPRTPPDLCVVHSLDSDAPTAICDFEGATNMVSPEASDTTDILLSKSRKFALLFQLNRSLQNERDEAVMCREVLRVAAEATGADCGHIALYGEDDRLVTINTWEKSADKDWQPVISKTIQDYVLVRRRGVVTTDACDDDRFADAKSITFQNVRSLLAAPIIAGSATLGMLQLEGTPSLLGFTKSQLDMLGSICSVLGLALDNARLRQLYPPEVAAHLATLRETEAALKQRDAELDESEARAQAMLRAIPDMVFRLDRENRFVDSHLPLDSTPLLEPEQFIGKLLEDVLPPEVARSWLAAIQTARAAPGDISVARYAIEDSFFEVRVCATRGGAELWAIVRDVTRRTLEEEARYRALFAQSKDMIFAVSVDGTIIDVNESACQVFQRTAETFAQMDPEALFPVDEQPRARQAWEELLAVGEAEVCMDCLRADGSRIILEAHGQILDLEHGKVVTITARDITQRLLQERHNEELREQLAQAQKMEALGVLAGGIAHDFNNLLSVILSFSEFALEATPSDSEARDDLGEVIGAARRAASLTGRLLSFARKGPVDLELTCVCDLIEDATNMLRTAVGSGIDLTIVAMPSRPVEVDPRQLEQVLLNLCINARDAMSAGGQVTIRCGLASYVLDGDPDYERNNDGESTSTAKDDLVIIQVQDNGSGMPEEVRQRVFEPFFSTKGSGGTGLGLAMAHGFANDAGGSIRVDSTVGLGTTFTLTLPAVAGAAAEAMIASRLSDECAGDGRCVLVVDDEPRVAAAVRRYLELDGFVVITADSVLNAVVALDCPDNAIALVLTDVVMPGASGIELRDELSDRWPHIPLLFMSGYAEEAIIRHGLSVEDVPYLSKPLNRRAVVKAVVDLLGCKATRPDPTDSESRAGSGADGVSVALE